MTTSDFLVILSILVALVAITVANNKKLWLYKFSSLSWVIGGIWAVLVNFLIFYESLRDKGMPAILEFSWGIRADYWGYFLSVTGLLGLMIYVVKGKHFPKRNWDKIIDHYSNLLNTDAISCLSYIKQYHLDNLKKEVVLLNSNVGTSKQHTSLEEGILKEVILSKNFIEKCVIIDPELFFDIIGNLQTNNSVIKTKIEYFLHLFFQSANFQFGLNLRYIAQDFEMPTEGILKHIFPKKDVNFILKYNVWDIFGKEAELNARTFIPSHNTTSDNRMDFQSSCSYYYLYFFIAQIKYFYEYQQNNPQYYKELNGQFLIEDAIEDTSDHLRVMAQNSLGDSKNGDLATSIRNAISLLMDEFCIIGGYASDDSSLDFYAKFILELQSKLTTDLSKTVQWPPTYPKEGVKRTIEDYLRLSNKYQKENLFLQAFYRELEIDRTLNFFSYHNILDIIDEKFKQGESFQKIQKLFGEYLDT